VFSLDDLAVIMGRIVEAGIDAVVIGGTAVQLALKSRRLEGDLDLFALSPSPLLEEEVYRGLADRMGWDYSYTDLGTPRLLARVRGEEIPVEFYENIHDFYVPREILEEAASIRVRGLRIRVIGVEDHLVLKARAGGERDLARLRELASNPRLRVDPRRLRERAGLFEEEQVILRRLRDAGFRV
jgi:predicted nucleotidyltransferase